MKILITGGNNGYIGRNLYKLFSSENKHQVYCPSKNILNLLDKTKVEWVLKSFNPDIIIHTAIQGGNRLEKDSVNIIKNNVEMYENLMKFVSKYTTVIIFGSGAEFDKRKNIDHIDENEIYNRFPVDPYGISKNIITRQAIQDVRKVYVLRLFGCFNYDEEYTRFIKNCIINIKNNNTIQINKNIYMDFFYLDDVFTVINHIINNKNITERHINLVYNDKYTLKTIANKIKVMMKREDLSIVCHNYKSIHTYTGSGLKLKEMNLNLIGLDEGIARTIQQLS